MTKVSFVCPIFNKIRYLSEVLHSIRSQIGSFEKEYIFINDGSTDGSLEYLKKNTRNWKNVKILNQSNKGPSNATQKGIIESTGDFIKLVGGDDIMSPECTNLLLKLINKSKSVAIFSRYELVDNFKKIKFDKQTPKNLRTISNPLYQTIKSSFSGTTPTLYCKKAINKSGGCNINLFVEDFSLVLGISRFGSFSFIDNTTSYGPKNDENRIMIGKKTQLIHDYNAALYYFVKENTDISPYIKITACKKSLGRTEKWARRILKKSIFNKMNFLKVKFYLRKTNLLELIKESCIYFYDKVNENEIRYKLN